MREDISLNYLFLYDTADAAHLVMFPLYDSGWVQVKCCSGCSCSWICDSTEGARGGQKTNNSTKTEKWVPDAWGRSEEPFSLVRRADVRCDPLILTSRILSLICSAVQVSDTQPRFRLTPCIPPRLKNFTPKPEISWHKFAQCGSLNEGATLNFDDFVHLFHISTSAWSERQRVCEKRNGALI